MERLPQRVIPAGTIFASTPEYGSLQSAYSLFQPFLSGFAFVVDWTCGGARVAERVPRRVITAGFGFWVRFCSRLNMRRCPGRGAVASTLNSRGYNFCLDAGIRFITIGFFTILSFSLWVRFRSLLDMRRCPGSGADASARDYGGFLFLGSLL